MTSTTAGIGARPLRRDAARNRRRILEAASEVFAERGIEASLLEVAERAGVGVGTIYRRFPDKDALTAALVDDKRAAVVEVAALALEEPTGWQSFCHLLGGLTSLLVLDRAIQELMLSEVSQRGATRVLADLHPSGDRIIERAQAEGSLRADFAFNDIPPLLCMLSAVAEFTAPIGDERWERYLSVILAGLDARGPTGVLPGQAPSDAEVETATLGYNKRCR